MVKDVQRCFTIYFPPNRVGEKLPVMINSNCYSKDKLSGLSMTNIKSGHNVAARQFGFARIGISTPDGTFYGFL